MREGSNSGRPLLNNFKEKHNIQLLPRKIGERKLKNFINICEDFIAYLQSVSLIFETFVSTGDLTGYRGTRFPFLPPAGFQRFSSPALAQLVSFHRNKLL